MARPEVKEEEKKGVEEEKLLDKEDAADLTILQGGVASEGLKKDVEDNRKEEGKEEKEDSSKTKEKKLSVEEQRESAKIEKCYKASLLKLQKAFKIPELEEGQTVTIKYGNNKKITLGKDVLEMKVLDGTIGKRTETRHLLGKAGEVWKGNTFKHTENMLDAQFNPPFEAEEFVGKLDEFIKDADQCKVESHTKEDNRKEEGKEEKEDSSKTKEKKPYGLLENFDKFWKLLMDKEAYEGKEQRESAVIEKCFSALQKVLHFRNGSIEYGDNKLELKGNSVKMKIESADKKVKTYRLTKNGEGLWKGSTTQYVEGMLSAAMIPFNAKEFISDLFEFIKDAKKAKSMGQCKIEGQTEKDFGSSSVIDVNNMIDWLKLDEAGEK